MRGERREVRYLEGAERLKGRDGDRHLGLMIIVLVKVGTRGMQLLGQLLIRVTLDREGLADREHLPYKERRLRRMQEAATHAGGC